MVTRGFAYLYTHKNADALELALKLDGRRFRKETISAQLSENVIFLLSKKECEEFNAAVYPLSSKQVKG